jgi:serine/threonine protein kinase
VGEDLQPGDPSQIGPYRLTAVLGSGGMGRVYLGRSPAGRRVAVKVIRAELAADQDFRVRFGREVAAVRQVSGLYTASVVDADVDGHVPWLATAYIPGQSLAEAIAGNGPLPPAGLRGLALGLAEGLAAIHAAGLVHRDLKPSNVLLSDDGPRVIDFGISRALEASALTHTGMIVGTPGFMSPEQAEGRAVGPASDVFSLGAVLAFAATGQGPFGDGGVAALVYRVVHGTPDLEGVCAEPRALIEKCLAKDPSARPATADLIAELGDAGPAWAVKPDVTVPSRASASPSTVAPAPASPAGPPVAAPAASPSPSPVVPPSPSRVASPAAPPVASPFPSPVASPAASPVAAAPASPDVPPVAAEAGSAANLPSTMDVPHSVGRPSPAVVAGRWRRRRAFWVTASAGSAVAATTAIVITVALLGAPPSGARTAAGPPGMAAKSSAPPGERPRPTPSPTRAARLAKHYAFSSPVDVIADGAHVWVANKPPDGPASVTEINPRTGARIRVLSDQSIADPLALASDGAHLWVANGGDVDNVGEFNAIDGRRASASFDALGSVSAPGGLLLAGKQLWVASRPPAYETYALSGIYGYTGLAAEVLNASDGSTAASLPYGAHGLGWVYSMTLEGSHVWIATAQDSPPPGYNGPSAFTGLIEYDAASGHFQRAIPFDDSQVLQGMAVYGDHIWAAETGNVVEVNLSNGAVRYLLPAQLGSSVGAHPYRPPFPAHALTIYKSHLFVANGDSVAELDAATGALVRTFNDAAYGFSGAMAIAVAGGRAWVANPDDGLGHAGSVTEFPVS